MRRLVFLPGFSEDESIFRNLRALLPPQHEQLDVDYRPVLKDISWDELSIDNFIPQLIDYYQIQSDDILIGHSTGGWFSYNIKALLGCNICLIGAFSSARRTRGYKVIYKRKKLVKNLMRLGIIGPNLVRWRIVTKHRGKVSIPERKEAIRVWKETPNASIAKMFLLIDQTPLDDTIKADLRLHSKKDEIVFPPKSAPYVELDGDHFGISTHAEEYAAEINRWLNQLTSPQMEMHYEEKV